MLMVTTCRIKQIFSTTIITKRLVIKHAKFEIDVLNILPLFEVTTEIHTFHWCVSA